MSHISEADISISPAEEADSAFLRYCCQSDDYRRFINEVTLNPNSTHIISVGRQRIGMVRYDQASFFSMKVVRPSIYIVKAYRLCSAHAIISSIVAAASLFQDVDAIQFLVYDDNKPCIALFDSAGIKYEAELPTGDNEHDKLLIYTLPLQEDAFSFRKALPELSKALWGSLN